MKGNLKSLPAIFAAVLIIAAAVFWFMGDDLEHIEDTNGADNFALEQITDENIINLDIGALNFTEKESLIGETVEYKSDKFTGVAEIYGSNLATNRFTITVNHAKVTEGNFKMVLLVDDEIVHEFQLNELTQEFVMEDVMGYVSLRIAGESANFMFDYHID